MPIKGLTDTSTPLFRRIGKLRKGGEKEDPKRPGPELPYWRFTSPDTKVETAFTEAYGAEPTELEVFLPYVHLDDNWQTWKEAWAAGGLQHRCDGEICVLWLDAKGNYVHDPEMRAQHPCPGGCKQVGRLSLVLMPLVRAGYFGCVTMETHSINDLLSIQGTLNAISEATRDEMQNIPFVLRRVEKEISTPGSDGKRVSRKKYLVELVLLADWAREQLIAGADDGPSLALQKPWSHLAEEGWQKFLTAAMKAFGTGWGDLVGAIKEDDTFDAPYTTGLGQAAKAHLATRFGMPEQG